jgi:hypothetical protein
MSKRRARKPIGELMEQNEDLRLNSNQLSAFGAEAALIYEIEQGLRRDGYYVLDADSGPAVLDLLRAHVLPDPGGRSLKSYQDQEVEAEACAFWRAERRRLKKADGVSADVASARALRAVIQRWPQLAKLSPKTIDNRWRRRRLPE